MAEKSPSPEARASFVSKMFFSYFDKMIWTGWKKPLTADDLYDLDPKDGSTRVSQQWGKNWEKQETRKKKSSTNKSKKQTKMSVVPTILSTFGCTWLWSSLLQLVTICLNQTNPYLVSLLIRFTSGDEEVWVGYVYVVVLFGMNFLKTILTNQFQFSQALIGMRTRTALTSSIYQKSLRLSSSARKNRTVGETINLMSIDTQRFMDITQLLNSLWASPLIIATSLFFLWEYLGPSCLAGLAVMALLIPLNATVATQMKKHQFVNMKQKDSRIKVMNEVLEGIKVLKLYAWEPSFTSKVEKIREEECSSLKYMAYLQALQTLMFHTTPFFVSLASFASYVFADPENVLDAEKAFVSLTFFGLMRQPLNQFPHLIVMLIQVSVSVNRINEFMNADELSDHAIGRESNGNLAVEMEKATFTWDTEAETLAVKDYNLAIKKGSLVAVVGQVGCGKSSLLSAITNDMARLSGRVNVDGSIAFVPQQAWIQNSTLRYNITFGMPLDQTLYDKVVSACAMEQDLQILAKGDLSEIGERGINLSGGQKARVSLARAIYCDRDIYLLDDPLSAVDAHVGKHIFDNVISSDTGILREKTRILVTHAVSYLPKVDAIIVVKDGSVSEMGSYSELMQRGGEFSRYLIQHLQPDSKEYHRMHSESETESELGELREELEKTLGKDVVEEELRRSSITSEIKGGGESAEEIEVAEPEAQSLIPGKKDGLSNGEHPDKGKGELIAEEKVETKAVGKAVYWYYTKSVGLTAASFTVLLHTANQAFTVGTNVWLAEWSDDPDSALPKVRDLYLGIYGALGAGTALAVMGATLAAAVGGLNASSKLHNKMLANVLRAPMSFFDTNTKGRILNRFARDVEYVDRTIPMNVTALIRLVFQLLGTVFVICFANPIFVAVVVPMAGVFMLIQRIFIKTARQLKRLESVTRSPIYAHFSETLSGVSTIRAYDLQARFNSESSDKIDANNVTYRATVVASRWVTFRLEMIANVIILFAALFAVLGRGSLEPGLVGLSLSYAMQITQTLNFVINQLSMLETNMVSVERIQEYQDDIASEAAYYTDLDPKGGGDDGDQKWPPKGVIQFEDYRTRYRPELELVLKGISCRIDAGERIGVVGRTGAGKSSLTLALFRIIESAEGSILIDGTDIAPLGLGFLRSRLTIIPQDPFLFSGSLRSNLDPFAKYDDDDLWQSLRLSHLQEFVSGLPGGLQYEIAEGGSNLSAGQKQLLCLARALLRKTQILVLDECTAAVDLETDGLIQTTIRKEFAGCTVITIAHRLNTILDSDKVMVLSEGKVVEFDSPASLLQDQGTIFYSLAKDSGLIQQEKQMITKVLT